jgi:hypothetical protein
VVALLVHLTLTALLVPRDDDGAAEPEVPEEDAQDAQDAPGGAVRKR